ncbi:MAG: zinc ribbon domain-containing protein [Thermodesulfobacteriota bacterium]
MRNTIKVLEQIQRFDIEIRSVEDEEKRYTAEIDAATSESSGLQQAVDAVSAEIEELQGLINAIDERTSENAEKIKKDEGRLNDIKNSREMNALNREISAANRANKQNEQEKGNLVSRVAEKEERLSAEQARLEEKKEMIARLTSEMEEKRAGWKETLEEKLRQRDSIKKEVRPDILKKYEMIRSRRGGLAMAVVKDETCQGCYIHIPPQVYIQLQKGVEEIINCPHCHRILYAEDQGELEAI